MPTAPIIQTTLAVVKYASNNIHTNLMLSTRDPPAEPSHSESDSHLRTGQKENKRSAMPELTKAPKRERARAAALNLVRIFNDCS